jgi:hypothetical protein
MRLTICIVLNLFSAKQFVTVDQVDRARTSEIAESEALKQAESQLRMSQAGYSLPWRNMNGPNPTWTRAKPITSKLSTLSQRLIL